MHHPTVSRRVAATTAAGLLCLGLAASGALAAEEEVAIAVTPVTADEIEDVNTGALSITFDNSFTTAYMFRGIMNERDGLIWQPAIDLSINLFSAEEGILESVDVGVGIWNSIHSEDTGSTGNGPDAMYETDYYPSLSLTWGGGVTTALTYYWYTSPNNAFRTVEEVAIDLSYDDSELLGAFSLSPTATFAFETHRSSFGGIGKGASLELGIEPGYEFKLPCDDAEKYPIGVTLPVKLGLSLDDYYKDGPANNAFGYALIGLHAGIPIGCIPPRFGTWTVTNGFDVYFLSDTVRDYARVNFGMGDTVYPVWTSSITMEY